MSKKVLKLANNNSSTVGLLKNPFNDEATMGPRLMDSELGRFQFYAMGHELNKEKNVAVKIITTKGFTNGEKLLVVQMESVQKGQRGRCLANSQPI